MSPRFAFVVALVAAAAATAGAAPARADVVYAGPSDDARPVFVREDARGRVLRVSVSWIAGCRTTLRMVSGTARSRLAS